MEKLMEILLDFRPDVDFENENKLFDNRILDSFDIATLVMEINDEFDVEIGVKDLVPENFNSAEMIFNMIKRLKEEED